MAQQHMSTMRRWTGSAWSTDAIAYNNRANKDLSEYVMVNEFNSAYYSGLDMSVYFNGIFIDEIISMQFQEIEQVKPLFGYGDYTFRKVCHGARLVNGSFVVNFKDSGYLLTLLRMISGEDASYGETVKNVLTKQKAVGDKKTENSLSITQVALKGDYTLEDFVSISIQGRKQPNYADRMNTLDSAIWDDKGSSPVSNSETANLARRIDSNQPKYRGPKNGFDIVLKYGQPEDPATKEMKPGFGTIEAIRSCYITGVQKSIDDSGRNILESYSFIASTVA